MSVLNKNIRLPGEKRRVTVLVLFVALGACIPDADRNEVTIFTMGIIPVVLGAIIGLYWRPAGLFKKALLAVAASFAILFARWLITSVCFGSTPFTYLYVTGDADGRRFFLSFSGLQLFAPVSVLVLMYLLFPSGKEGPAVSKGNTFRFINISAVVLGICAAALAIPELPWIPTFLKIRAAALKERPLVDELRRDGCVFNEVIWWNAHGESLLTDWAIKGPYVQVQHIRFANRDVSQVPFAKLKELEHLESIDLSDSNVRADQLVCLRGMELVSIALRGTKITPEGLHELAGVKGLTYLDLGRSSITDEMLENFNPSDLVALSVADTQITDAGLVAIGRMTKLGDLDLSRTKVSDDGIAHLSQSGFETLNLSSTSITDRSLALIRERFGNRRLSLNISHTRISDAALEDCARMFLEELDLTGNQVTDRGIEHLTKLEYLKRLKVGATQVTAATADNLLRARAAYKEAFANSGNRTTTAPPPDLRITFELSPEKTSLIQYY